MSKLGRLLFKEMTSDGTKGAQIQLEDEGTILLVKQDESIVHTHTHNYVFF